MTLCICICPSPVLVIIFRMHTLIMVLAIFRSELDGMIKYLVCRAFRRHLMSHGWRGHPGNVVFERPNAGTALHAGSSKLHTRINVNHDDKVCFALCTGEKTSWRKRCEECNVCGRRSGGGFQRSVDGGRSLRTIMHGHRYDLAWLRYST